LNPKDKPPLIGAFSVPERVTAVDRDSFSQPPVSTDSACLVVIYGPELGKRAALGQGNFEIGRSSRSDLPIDQESISRHHARISFDGQRHVIEDLGSTNGTYIGSQRITTPMVVSIGVQVRVGKTIAELKK
jgi:pSer/pThr/pTyr-binding forkhead associated (FHA) protein